MAEEEMESKKERNNEEDTGRSKSFKRKRRRVMN